MKLRCLIVDDKPLAIALLTDYAGKVPTLEVAGTTRNPLEGLQMLEKQSIDLVFLDIQMPELSGLDFIKQAKPGVRVILTTAYADYALAGYEHDVVDYLLKPISFERFCKAVEKAKRFHQSPSFIFVRSEGSQVKIDLERIRYVESMQNYIVIHTTTGKVMSLQPLKKMEALLPADKFIRVHKRFIVSLSQINIAGSGRIAIGETMIPIGDTYRQAVTARFK